MGKIDAKLLEKLHILGSLLQFDGRNSQTNYYVTKPILITTKAKTWLYEAKTSNQNQKMCAA